jgi:hypothetical protein
MEPQQRMVQIAGIEQAAHCRILTAFLNAAQSGIKSHPAGNFTSFSRIVSRKT